MRPGSPAHQEWRGHAPVAQASCLRATAAPARRAFTFVELMCALSIIIIMWLIIIPIYGRAKAQGRARACGHGLRQIGIAMQIYARDHGSHLPPAEPGPRALLPRYIGEEEALRCPAAVYQRDHWRGPLASKPTDVGYRYRAGLCDDDLPQTPVMADSTWDRHFGRANMLFLDTHTKSLPRAAAERAWRQGEVSVP